jgi:arylsulfatase A-like enzyme
MWRNEPGFNAALPAARRARLRGHDVDDTTEDPRFGAWGGSAATDTGPLTSKRMQTVDEEFLARTSSFITKTTQARRALLRLAEHHADAHLHAPQARVGQARGDILVGFDVFGSGMIEHDGHVGQLLKLLDELKIADNTIVIYTSDNGAMVSWWPDGGTTPFRGEKATTWEGGVRVPMLLRWPARVKARAGLQRHPDARGPVHHAGCRRRCGDVPAKLRESHKVFIDGVDNLEHWTGNAPSGATR